MENFSIFDLQLVSAESEELNRALVLTIARAIHVTGLLRFYKLVDKNDVTCCS